MNISIGQAGQVVSISKLMVNVLPPKLDEKPMVRHSSLVK